VNNNAFVVTAGLDQTLCSTTATLAGTTPGVGTGLWTTVAGAVSITQPTAFNTGITAINPGLNTLRWTVTRNGCSAFDEVSITNDSPSTADAGTDQDVCANTATLAANIPTIGTGAWSRVLGLGTITTPLTPNSGVTGLTIGTNSFRWTITNNACSTADEVVIVNNSFTISAGIDQVLCNSSATLAGEAPGAGTGVWTRLLGSATIANNTLFNTLVSNLTQGENIFRWTVQRNACTAFDDVTVRNDLPTPSVAGAAQSVCGSSATLSANNPSVGVGTWSTVSGTGVVNTASLFNSSVSGLSQGSNTFRWTIVNNACSSNSTVVVTNNSFTASAGSDQTLCSTNATLAGMDPVPGTGVWSQVLGSGAFASDTRFNTTVSSLANGTNVFRWTVSKNGCESSDEVTIVNDLPTVANAGVDQSTCGTTATLAANSPVYGSGLWTVASGLAVVTTPSQFNSAVTNLSAGTNTLVWTITNSACSSSDNVNILNNSFTISAGVDQTLCTNSTNLEGTSPGTGTGTWSTVIGSTNIVNVNLFNSAVSNLNPGINIYRWTVQRDGCDHFDDVTITNNSPTVAATEADKPVCSNTASISANNPVYGSGQWSVVTGLGTITSPMNFSTSVSGLSAGVNRFRWTITNSGCSSSDELVVTNNSFTVNAGGDQVLCAANSSLDGTDPLSGTGVWTIPVGSATLANPALFNTAVTGLNSGTNVFRWTVTRTGCTVFDEVNVTNNLPSVAAAGLDQSTCGTTATLSANNPAIGSGLWTTVSGLGMVSNSTQYNSTITNLSTGTNTFLWTITNNGCVSQDDVTVTNNSFNANAGVDQTICASSTNLAGGDPAPGTGVWTTIVGSNSIAIPAMNTTLVSNLNQGANVYRWTVNRNGCVSSDEVTITNNLPTTAIAGANQDVCATTSTLAANEPSVGVGSWSVVSGLGTVSFPGLFNSTVVNLSSGTNRFRWTITNNGCSSSSDVVVRNNSFTTNAGIDQTLCVDGTTLSATAPGLGGSGIWSVIAGAATFTNATLFNTAVAGLDAGTNILRWEVTRNGCVDEDDVTLLNNAPTAADAGVDQNVCGTSTALAGNLAAIGTGVWTRISGAGSVVTPGDFNTTVTGLSAGTNTFRWTITNNGCSSQDDITVLNNTFTISAGSDQNVCADNTTLAGADPTPGTGVWSTVLGSGSFVSGGLNTTQVVNLSQGTNIFRWTVTKNGCTASDEVAVENNLPTTPNAGSDQTLCVSNTILAGNDPSIGSGVWSRVTGLGTVNDPTKFNTTVSTLSSGTNTFRWTITNNGCSRSDDVAVVNNAFTANAGTDQTLCQNFTALSATNPTSGAGTWSVVVGVANISNAALFNSNVTGIGAGTNIFRWTVLQNGCTEFDDVVVVNDTPTTAAAGGDQNVCQNSATLSATPATIGTGNWSVVSSLATISQALLFNTTVTGLNSGPNTFRWTITKNGCSSSDEVVVTNNQFVVDAGVSQSICTTTAALSATPAGGTWTVGVGTGVFSNQNNSSATVNGVSAGTNVYRWTVSQSGCTFSDDVVITNDSPTVANAGPDQNVCGTTTTLAGNSAAIGAGQWTRVTGLGLITTATDFNSGVTNLSSGINTFRWTIAKNACSTSDDVVVTNSQFTVSAGVDQTICASGTTLAGDNPGVGVGTWSIPVGTGIISNSGLFNSAVSALNAGTNTFRWTVTRNGCTAFDEVNITNNLPTPSSAGPDQAVCVNSATLAGNNATIGGGQWVRISGLGTITTPTLFNTTVTSLSAGSNVFKWVITNHACVSEDEVEIVNNDFVVDAGADQTICASTTTFAASVHVSGVGTWSTVVGSNTISNTNNATATVSNLFQGTNRYRWTVVQNACTEFDEVTIVNDSPTVPNAGADRAACVN